MASSLSSQAFSVGNGQHAAQCVHFDYHQMFDSARIASRQAHSREELQQLGLTSHAKLTTSTHSCKQGLERFDLSFLMAFLWASLLAILSTVSLVITPKR